MRIGSNSSKDSSITSVLEKIPINPASVTSLGSIAYDSGSKTIISSDGNTWSPSGSSFPGTTLVFRPGYTGSAYDNIFGSWTELYTKLLTIETIKNIYMDDTLLPFGDPIVIPPGIWDMKDVTWFVKLCRVHTFPVIFTFITISDGATINGLCGISGPIVVTYEGTGTNAAMTFNTPPDGRHAAFSLGLGTTIVAAGTQPFMRVSSGFAEIITLFSSSINGPSGSPSSSVQPLDVSAGAQLIIVLGVSCSLQDDAVSGAGITNCIRISTGAITSVPPVQPASTGGFFLGSTYTSPDTYQRPIPPVATDDDMKGYKVGDLWIDTTASMLYTAISVSTGTALWHGPY
jgi:hypothetical protein